MTKYQRIALTAILWMTFMLLIDSSSPTTHWTQAVARLLLLGLIFWLGVKALEGDRK